MAKIEDKKIPESSAFYQGHPEQLFTGKGNVTYKVAKIDKDREKTTTFNSDKYSKYFENEINKLLSQRKREGYELELVTKDNLEIVYPNFVDGLSDTGVSGDFRIYPDLLRCDICGTVVSSRRWNYSRICNCRPAKIMQLTFVLFCDACGKATELNYGSNLLNDCKCGGVLNSIHYPQKNNIATAQVKCNQCHTISGLVFYKCKHEVFIQNQIFVRSTLPHKRYRAIPPRAGSLTHPHVISIPKIRTDIRSDGNQTTSRSNMERQASFAFNHFFPDIDNIREAHLFHPEFKKKLFDRNEFWANEVVFGPLEKRAYPGNPETWSNEQFESFITSLMNKISHYISGLEMADIVEAYSLNSIRETLVQVSAIEFEEKDLQFSYLVNCRDENIRRTVISTELPLLKNLGIEEVHHFRELEIISALLGYCEGSSRREPVLFSPFLTRSRSNRPKKPTVFVRVFPTESILFCLSAEAVLEWLVKNNFANINIGNVQEPEIYLRGLLHRKEDDELDLELIKSEVKKLLHTMCHLFMNQSVSFTGLEITSMSEILFENDFAFMMYSTDSINTGGIEYAFNNRLEDWAKRFRDIYDDCNQDPGCITDEEGSCMACSYIPEFVCRHFNNDLDRDTLLGKERYKYGFIKG